MKKIFLLLIAAALLVFGQNTPVSAAQGDIPMELYFQHGGMEDFMGNGFYRAGALWVPGQILRVMGVNLEDGPNNKGYNLPISNPAQVFGAPVLESLCGSSLSLYFSSLSVSGISYFNVTGMEKLLKLNYTRQENRVVFTANDSTEAAAALSLPPAPHSGRLNLVWEHVTLNNPDLGAMQPIAGLDVLSPTWFNLMDANGGCANRASAAFIASAHKKGYRVWPLVSNSFNGQLTTAFFKNARGMNLFYARLIAYAKLYGFSGYNFDFEGINESHREAFTRFMSRAGELLSAEGLTISVDTLIPSQKSSSAKAYDRAALARSCDYLMLMAYDEHWRTSPRAGSVASMPWVTKAVETTLAEGVPASKLVLGIPFYMRRWEETPTGSGVKVKASTLSMAEAEALAAKTGAPMSWLEREGQHYFSYQANGKTYKVWVENAASISRKLELVKKYGLAGVAGWRRGFEKPELWKTIADQLEK